MKLFGSKQVLENERLEDHDEDEVLVRYSDGTVKELEVLENEDSED